MEFNDKQIFRLTQLGDDKERDTPFAKRFGCNILANANPEIVELMNVCSSAEWLCNQHLIDTDSADMSIWRGKERKGRPLESRPLESGRRVREGGRAPQKTLHDRFLFNRR